MEGQSYPRRLARFITLASMAASAAGCMAFAPVVDEPLRVTAVADLSAADLGLRAGVSTLEEARDAMNRRGLTGVVEDVFADDAPADGGARAGSLAAITADYQSRVFVFRGDRLSEIVTLPLHGLPPYGMSLRVGRDDVSPMLLLLYRDPASRAEVPPTLLAFRPKRQANGPDRFELAAAKPLGELVARHDGMTSPMLLGGSLSDGMLLVARDRSGVLWDTSYLVRSSANGLSLAAQPMMDALRCSCVRKYVLETPL